MAQTKSEPKTYDADAEFMLRVARPVSVGPFKYLPRDEHKVTGAFLNDLIEENGADVVRTVQPV